MKLPLNAVLELGTVEFKRAPVFGTAFGTDVEDDGGGGANAADGALLGLAPLLLDLLVELLEVLDRLVRVVHQAPSLPQLLLRLCNLLLVVISHPRFKLLDPPLVNLYHGTVTNGTHLDGVEKLVVGASAEKLDILARRTGAREDVVVIGFPVRL